MPEPLLRVEGLSLREGGMTELASVAFSVERASLTALTGPDRWDKDALIEVLQGWRRPTQGTLRLAGRPITRFTPAQRVRSGLVWTLPRSVRFATTTLVEAIVLAMAARRPTSPIDFLRRQPSAPMTARALEILTLAGLADRSGAAPGQLEAADQARLEIARVLAAGPRLMLVDRPGSVLSACAREALVSSLRHIARSGVTVLWVEDDVALALEFADQVVVLHAGRTFVPGAAGADRGRDALEAAFLGPQP